MLVLQDVSYELPNKDLLFLNINLTVNSHNKVAVIGNNGSGKSTLLKIIAGELQCAGHLNVDAEPYYVPQIFGQFNHLSIAQALQIEDKLNALNEVLSGNATEQSYDLLSDDWGIAERCNEALAYWQLSDLDLSQKMATLSGGQKTKVFLAGISVHQRELILLDEPSNHLDISSRQLLYDFILTTQRTLVVVSHDRKLLNLLNTVCELTKNGMTTFGGNFDFYWEQKLIERNTLDQDLQGKEKALRMAKQKERETAERQQKLDARGKKKQEKAGVARIMMNTLRNSAENSTSKIKGVHAEKIDDLSRELQELRSSLPAIDKIKFEFANSGLHKGKVLFGCDNVNFSYDTQSIWKENLNFKIASGERIALKGQNGSGKTTLIKLILAKMQPQTGEVFRAENKSVYIDQDYSLIDNSLKVYDQAQKFNADSLQEHEVKIILNRSLFTKEDWDKPCRNLSGGEKMRLMLCCLTLSAHAPDIIILDEPTNNLDLQNIEILTKAINEYQGTLIVVSHDEYFLEQVQMERTIKL